MAQSLDDRIASALKPGSRLADCESLLIEVRAEIDRVTATQAKAEDRRSDPTVSEADAADANLEVEEAKLRLIRLARADTALAQTIASKKVADVEKAARARYDQVRKRRDDLAAELVERVAPMFDELTSILARIVDNDREIDGINRTTVPEGCPDLVSAEVVARGKHARIYTGRKLVDMEIPLFAHPGLAWPSSGGDPKAEAVRREESEQRRVQANADREASKARYLISIGTFKGSYPAAVTEGGKLAVQGTVDAWCYPNQVEHNRKIGLKVEPWTAEAAASIADHRSAFEKAIA